MHMAKNVAGGRVYHVRDIAHEFLGHNFESLWYSYNKTLKNLKNKNLKSLF